MKQPVLNLDLVKLETQQHGEEFEAKLGAIASRLGWNIQIQGNLACLLVQHPETLSVSPLPASPRPSQPAI